MDRVVIAGTAGLARELTDWIAGHFEIAGYQGVDRAEFEAFGLDGGFFGPGMTPGEAGTGLVLVATGRPALKQKIHAELAAAGFEFPSFVHRSAVVSPLASLGPGAIVAPNAVVASRVRLGACVYVNFGATLGHEAEVGDFCQINPGAQIGGGTSIGAGTLIGSGAAVIENMKVGAGATVGSGAVVFGRVADGATVVGPPAKRMRAFEG